MDTTIIDSAAMIVDTISAIAPITTTTPEVVETISKELFTTNNLWMMISTCLVFIMHLGFATLEAGLTRSKNTVNILFKNLMIVPIGILITVLPTLVPALTVIVAPVVSVRLTVYVVPTQMPSPTIKSG